MEGPEWKEATMAWLAGGELSEGVSLLR